GLMMLAVMDLHGLRIDVRLKRVKRVGQGGQCMGHLWQSPVKWIPTSELENWCVRSRAFAPPRNDAGKNGQEDHEQNDLLDVLVDSGYPPTQEVAGEQHAPHPGESTNDIVRE